MEVINMPAKKRGEVSKRKMDEIRKYRKKFVSIIQGQLDVLDKMTQLGKSLSPQQYTFLNRGPEMIMDLESAMAEETKEVHEEGWIKEMQEKGYRMINILKAINYPEGKEGLVKVMDEFHYYICEVCGYYHKVGEECPFIILEKEDNKDKGDDKDRSE